MKIAFLIPAIDAMGPNIFTFNLIKGLIALNSFDCEVFHFDRGSKDIKQLEFPVKVTVLDFNKTYDFKDFDIIHSTMPVPDLYIVKHKLYKKYLCVTSMHCFMESDLYQRKGKIKGWLEVQLWKFALNKFHHLIVSSQSMKEYYSKILVSNHNFKIIPYGIPLLPSGNVLPEIVSKITLLRNNYKVLCGCGSLIKRKGFQHLVRYLVHNKNAAVVLIGRGEMEAELKSLTRELQVSNRVLFLGFLKDSYLYYPYMDAYCMCSNSEGFGLAMIEAMQMRTPIICTNLGIYKEYFDNSSVGLFEFENQESFNNAADTVLANIDYYADRAKLLADNVFSLKNMASQHYEYYQKLIVLNTHEV